MSKLNGERARFQRERKAGLLRRERSRAAFATAKLQAVAARAEAGQAAADGGVATPIPVKIRLVAD